MQLQFSGRLEYFFLAFLLGSLLTYLGIIGKSPIPLPDGYNPNVPQTASFDYVITRVKGYEYVRPLLSAEPKRESSALASFKLELTAIIDSLKEAGSLTEASIYLREFNYGEWLAINPTERYHPASLTKVVLLLTYLRLAEANPGLLTQKILYQKPQDVVITPQYYAFPTIEPAKEYTVHDLLYYLVAYSDNNASWLLASRLDPAQTKKMFRDLGLPEPVEERPNFTLTAEEVSVFFKAIINASYLSPEYSEYAARLLSNCAFKEGFGQGLPTNTKMWHKFGEWREAGSDYELHEAGVIYIQETPFLITILTRGKNTEQQAGCISLLSRTIYKNLEQRSKIDR